MPLADPAQRPAKGAVGICTLLGSSAVKFSRTERSLNHAQSNADALH